MFLSPVFRNKLLYELLGYVQNHLNNEIAMNLRPL